MLKLPNIGKARANSGGETLEQLFLLVQQIRPCMNFLFMFLDVKRKLAFMGKPGYDIFGNNKLFAPRIKWEALENTVEDVKDAAEKYETAFNEIIKAQTDAENFQEVSSHYNKCKN